MPDFLITSPDGTKYQVTGPDGSTEEDALAQVRQQHEDKSAPVTASGLAKAAGVGVGKGLISLAGAPADLTDLAARGFDAVTGKNMQRGLADFTGPFGSDAIQKKVESYTGEFRKPQNKAEEWANTAGEFAPLIATGPGGLGRRFLTNVAAPALGSEAAGALTEGTAAEPYARMIGAVAGGAGASRIGRAMDARAAVNSGAPLAELKAGTKDQYDNITSRNVATPIKQSDLDSLSTDIKTTLNQQGIRPSTADKIHNAVEEIKTPATGGAPDIADLVANRQNIKSLLSSPDANKAGAVVALKQIDAAIEQLSPGTMAKIRTADMNWSAVKANEALDKRIARAEIQAGGANSGMNVGNKIRQNVGTYLNSNEARYLSDANKASLQKVVDGTRTQNAFRYASNLLGGGGGIGSTLVGALGAEEGIRSGHPELALAPLAGYGFRKFGNRLTQGQAAKAAAEIRNRSPFGQQQATQQQSLQALQRSPSPIAQAIYRAIVASQDQRLSVPFPAVADQRQQTTF